MSAPQPSPATEQDIPDIDTLLCSAQGPIGLSESFCASENRPRRLEWFQKTLAYNLLWVIRDGAGLAGVMILEQDESARILELEALVRVVGIAYIVVAERMRGQREIGPRLLQKAQALANAGFLRAEARNNNSRRLLEKYGFQTEQESSPSGHPILIWYETARGAQEDLTDRT